MQGLTPETHKCEVLGSSEGPGDDDDDDAPIGDPPDDDEGDDWDEDDDDDDEEPLQARWRVIALQHRVWSNIAAQCRPHRPGCLDRRRRSHGVFSVL